MLHKCSFTIEESRKGQKRKKKIWIYSPGRCCSMIRESALPPNGCRFDSSRGYVPGGSLDPWPWSVHVQEETY